MDACSDPSIREVVVMAGAQLGKSEALLNIIGYHIDNDPSPILVLQPTLEMAQAFSKDRVANGLLKATVCLRGKVKDPRARDSGNTTLHKLFPGGSLTLVGANSPSGLASRPIRLVLCDEVDRYPASAGSEGDPIQLARKGLQHSGIVKSLWFLLRLTKMQVESKRHLRIVICVTTMCLVSIVTMSRN